MLVFTKIDRAICSLRVLPNYFSVGSIYFSLHRKNSFYEIDTNFRQLRHQLTYLRLYTNSTFFVLLKVCLEKNELAFLAQPYVILWLNGWKFKSLSWKINLYMTSYVCTNMRQKFSGYINELNSCQWEGVQKWRGSCAWIPGLG